MQAFCVDLNAVEIQPFGGLPMWISPPTHYTETGMTGIREKCGRAISGQHGFGSFSFSHTHPLPRIRDKCL